MLVLNRKFGEELIVDDNIIFRILNIYKNVVTVGIDAPKDIKILRSELTDSEIKSRKDLICNDEEMDIAISKSIKLREKLKIIENMINQYKNEAF